MISELIAICLWITRGSVQLEPLWVELPSTVGLLDVENGDGVAAVLPNGDIRVLHESGATIQTITVPRHLSPVMVTRDGLQVYVKPLIEDNTPFHVAVQPMVYGQFGTEFHISKGLVVFARHGIYSQSSFDRWSAVAINRTGTRIATMSRDPMIPRIQEVSFSSERWQAESQLKYATVPNIGIATVIPRFNDMRYLDDENLLFIGGVWAPDSKLNWAEKIRTFWTDLPSLTLESSSRLSHAFCFVMNIRTQVTKPVAITQMSGNGESGGYFAGRLSVSSTGKWLYIRCEKGIARMNIPSLLREVKREEKRKK